MRKWFMLCGLLWVVLTTTQALASPSEDLQSRLSRVVKFNASFTQTVKDASGNFVQQGRGQLWVQRPNLFKFSMSSPDKSDMISDGRTLWFYAPLMEQVIASSLEDATSNTPFVLIARNRSTDWQRYTITQSGDTFSLTPRSGGANLQQFTIQVTPAGNILSFTSIEQDGQRTAYRLGSLSKNVSPNIFIFNPPQGVKVDDQRR